MTKGSTRHDRVLALHWYVCVQYSRHLSVGNALTRAGRVGGSRNPRRGLPWSLTGEGRGRGRPQTLLTHLGGQRGTQVEYSTETRHWRHNSDNHGPACMLGTEIRMHTGTAVRGDMHSKRDRRAGVRKLPPRLTPKAPPANLTRGRGVYLAVYARR